jgi:hypothetical protein
MKKHLGKLAPVLAGFAMAALSATWMSAQITNQIHAHVAHSFMVGDKTLPPGDYTFRVEGASDEGLMVVQNQRGDNVAQFAVRQSIDNHRPKHSELVFKRYGNSEFLSKVYEGGSKNGVAVSETSKEEARMVSQGQHAMEHTEEEQ